MTGSVFRSLMKAWFFVLCVAALSACGSGGGGGDSLPTLPPVAAPTITTQPATVTVSVGQTATFNVAATGTGLIYQWKRGVSDIAGATAASYSLSNATSGDSGAQFSVVVTNLGGSVTSSVAGLTVTDPPAVVRGPEAASVVTGNSVTFSVVASGAAPLTYQWRRTDAQPGAVPVAIPGATLSTYTPAPAPTLSDHNAAYSVVVSNGAGSATSDPAQLSVFAVPQAITILSHPQNVTVRDTQRATFNVVIAGTGPFTVIWLRNGVDMPNTQLFNVTSTQYALTFLTSLATDNGALYSLRISNAFGSVTTNQGLLTVTP